MKTKLIILGLIALILGVAGYYAKYGSTAGWQTYTNDKYGFEFKYSADGELQDSEEDYARIQNYDRDSEIMYLNDELYYIEIYLDQKIRCQEAVRDAKEISADLGKIYTGQSYTNVSDSGGIRYLLCAERNNEVIQIVVTEKGSNDISEKIFSTFKFTK